MGVATATVMKRNMVLLGAAAAGVAGYGLMKVWTARTPDPEAVIDDTLDESFPASDPPGGY